MVGTMIFPRAGVVNRQSEKPVIRGLTRLPRVKSRYGWRIRKSSRARGRRASLDPQPKQACVRVLPRKRSDRLATGRGWRMRTRRRSGLVRLAVRSAARRSSGCLTPPSRDVCDVHSRLSIVRFANGSKRSMGHLLGATKGIFLIRDIDGPAMTATSMESCRSVARRSPWVR